VLTELDTGGGVVGMLGMLELAALLRASLVPGIAGTDGNDVVGGVYGIVDCSVSAIFLRTASSVCGFT